MNMDRALKTAAAGASRLRREALEGRELLQTAVSALLPRLQGDLPEEKEGPVLLFLLEYARRAGDDWVRTAAGDALERRRGTCDALLACAHLEAYAQTGRPGFRMAARDMLDYALRELRLPGGCFSRTGDVDTGWNAQMIAALAKASRVLGDGSYLRAAAEARLFLKTRLTQPGGRLWRRWRDRTPMEEGRLADYGLYCWALVELYESDFAVSCLREAEALADRMTEIFRDRQGGLYDFDAKAAGSGAAGLALSRLAQLTALERYRETAREQMLWLAGAGEEFLDGLGLSALVEGLWPRRELICACAGRPPVWLAQVGEEYRLAVLAKTHVNSRGLENAVPALRGFPVPEAGERLYLCRDGVCGAPAGNLSQLYWNLSAASGGREDVSVR